MSKTAICHFAVFTRHLVSHPSIHCKPLQHLDVLVCACTSLICLLQRCTSSLMLLTALAEEHQRDPNYCVRRHVLPTL
ncbi:hypothetical protein DENSPDRAFT_280717 [Dentipellis sp. KUC8613]|nr:hypothetical protein DENSPDRAFT_280717 [Dentipellis sp. KUC8613]